MTLSVVVECEAPEAGSNTLQHTYNGSFVFRDNFTHHCQDGYTYNGSLTATCLSDGNWSVDAPNCIGNVKHCIFQKRLKCWLS